MLLDDSELTRQAIAETLSRLNVAETTDIVELSKAHRELKNVYATATSVIDKLSKDIDKMEIQLEQKKRELTGKVDNVLNRNKEQREKIETSIRETVQNSPQYARAYSKVLKSGAISGDDPAIKELNQISQNLTFQLKKDNKEYSDLLKESQQLVKERERVLQNSSQEIKELQVSLSRINAQKAKLERDLKEINKQLNDTWEADYTVTEQKERERELRSQQKIKTAQQAQKTVSKPKNKPQVKYSLYSPAEIASGKVPVGQTVHVPMKLMTKGQNGERIHENVYTGISEEELVKKYHFTPAQAKKRASEFTAEQYNKYLPKPGPTVSKMAGIPFDAKEHTGPESAGRKGTAYHTVAEMALDGWSVEDIIQEYNNKRKKQKSALTQEQFEDLSGMEDIYKALGGKKASNQKALREHLESFANMIKPLASSQSRSFIEQTLGGVTNVDGKNIAWGGTFDAILGNLLLDFKSNQKMSDKMGTQVNILKFLVNLARNAGLDLPEIKDLSIAHQAAATKGGDNIPVAQVHRVTELSDQDLSGYIVEILRQWMEKEAGTSTAYNTKPFEKLHNLISPFTKTAFRTEAGEEITTWKDINKGFLKQMLAEAEAPEQIAKLADYFRANYAPEELAQVMKTLFGHTTYSTDGVGTKQDYFTAGSTWVDEKHPENVIELKKRLSDLRKKMLPSTLKTGEAGKITEETFYDDNEQPVDFIKLDGLNIGDWAVTYKTALEENDEQLADNIVHYLATTISDYFKDSKDTDSVGLGKKLANKVRDLSSEVVSDASEKVYDSLSQKVGEALGVDYSVGKQWADVNYERATDSTREAAKYYAPQIETMVDELGAMSSDDSEIIEQREERQREKDTFESIRAFELANSYDEDKLQRDAHETRKVKGDRLANWFYGIISQSDKIESLLEPYYKKSLNEANVDESQVNFQEFVQRILADNPALYQQYRDSQEMQKMFSAGAGENFGAIKLTSEQAAKGLEAIKQGIGGTHSAKLSREMDAFYGAWMNLEDSSEFDSLALKYAKGGKPKMPEGARGDLTNSLFSRMARGEGVRYYGKTDKMGADIPERYAQEIESIKIKEEELSRLANETQDALDKNVVVLQDRDEVYEKAIQELAISHFEKGLNIDATRDLLSRPDVQRNYNERKEALEEYRDLIGDSKAKLKIDDEGTAYEASKVDYDAIQENFKGSSLEEQFGSWENFNDAIDDALDKFANATNRLIGTKTSPGQIWDATEGLPKEVLRERLQVLRTMRNYDLQAQEAQERQEATIEETKATEYAKMKVNALDRMQETFTQNAFVHLQKIFEQNTTQHLADSLDSVSSDKKPKDGFEVEEGSDEDIYTPAGIDEVVASQNELTTAIDKRVETEQEATKIDQQSTHALQDESEALKEKALAARELISALVDKDKTEKEGIATDEKSVKTTKKRVTASETLKQRLANQKVREQIAESKAKEAVALSKAERGSGTKKQSAGEKEDYSKYQKNVKEITRAMAEREKIEKELNTTPSMLKAGRQSREALLVEYEGIISKLTTQNALMVEQGRLSKEQVAQLEGEAQAQRRLNSLKIQGQKSGANSIFDVLKSGVKNTMARMFDYTGVYRVINKMAASLQNVVQLSKELDTAMFNLRVVSGYNRSEAQGLISDYNDLAKQLGATTAEIANAANEWMRQGYEAEQATQLITASTYLSKLGMIEASQATEYLTSMIKGFKLEVSDAITVVDKLTKLDMVSATSSGGLAEAMRNVASSAQLANVSLDKTLAYAATIIETTQRDESSVGMSLRTILARYGNVKAGAFSNLNLAATGDADLENINDIEKVLKKIGISIRSSATEFRSFETVLDEVADKWERLDSVSKNAIATAFAGQRQRESFLVLMENMDRVDELTEISAESAGTATEKYQAYYESIESATKRLQTAWENLAHSFEVNGFVKGMTTFLTFVVENLPKIIKMVATLVAQTNAWKVPTLLKAGFNATGLGALKGALKNNSQEKLGLMDRFKARATAQQNKQKDWKKTTLEKSDGLDLFGLKGKMSKVASNMDKLVLALEANTKAQTQQTQVETRQIRSGTQANILSPVPNASEGYSIDEFGKTQKVPKFKLKNLISDEGKKPKTQDLYPGVPEFELKNLQADGTDLLPTQNALQTGLMGAAGAGLAAGVIGGITQEGSTEAKLASGAVQGASAALGAGLSALGLGPLGTMLGSVLGDVLGPIVADAVDKDANERKELVELGQKQLDMLSSLDSSFDTLDSSSRVELLSADDISSIRDIVSSIEETIQAEDSNLGKHLEKAFEEIGASEFYDNWDSKLVLGTQEERRAITRALQLAKSEAESEAYENSMAEKKYAALTTAEAKTYYKKVNEANVERAYIKSGVSEYSQYELTKKGIDGVINEVAKQLEGVDLKGIRLRDSFGELTEEAEAYIRTLMKTDDQMQNLLAGQTLTLNEALQEDNTELLEQFATALGVSVDKLQGFADTIGALTLGDLLAGMGETREKITSYTGLLSDFFTTGTVSPENLEDIIANYPDLINKVSNPKELLAGVQEKISQLGTQYVSAGISSWFSSEAVFDQFRKNFADKDDFKEIFSNKELLGDVKSLDEAKGIILKMQQEGSEYSEQAKELYDYIIKAGDAAQVELEYIRKQLEYTAEIEATMDTVDKNYEKQINALEEQKSALEDINNQREYENKLIEAKLKLENAQNEKKKVWREGVGWVYEADTTAIADAQQELDDLANQKTIDELQAQIDELQAQREYVAGIPDRLELEQANENFKTWTDKLGLVNDNQLSVINKIQEVWTELKTRSDEIEGRSETKSQFEQASQLKAAAEINLVGSGGSASAPAEGSAQKVLQDTYAKALSFDQTDNSDAAKSARQTYKDALGKYQEVYAKYVENGGETTQEQQDLNALQADSDDMRFAPKWESVQLPGGYYKKSKGRNFDVYASFEDVTDTGGWKQGGMKDVVLLSPIQGRADKEGISGFGDIRDQKYNGQLFLNTKGDDQLFWVYNDRVYRATRHSDQYKEKEGVNDSTYSGNGAKSSQNLTSADNFKWYAKGTLSAPGGLSMVNDDPQYGLEGIITPNGTLTALPSKSGVVPADMTRNVWQLGEVAPNLVKSLVDIQGKFNSPNGFGTDESFNVDHLDIHMVAQPGFSMDDFVRELKAARDLTRHS